MQLGQASDSWSIEPSSLRAWLSLLLLLPLLSVGLSDVEKSVVKATYDDELAPKEKHVVFLTECTTQFDVVSLFDRRLTMARWNVVFKALIVLHRLSIEGAERYMKDLALNHHTFNLRSFFDGSIGAQDHQEFIVKYADYLAQKVYVYKLLGVSVERRPPTESKEWARKLSGFDLVKALPALSQQFDRLLVCSPYGGDLMGLAIPVAALQLLVRDAFRMYSVLTVLMLGVVDHYLELDAPQTKLILSVCTAFKAQNARFKRWTQQLASVGFAHDKLFPDLVPIPDALFELLQDHMIAKGGVRPAPTAAAASAAQPGRKAAPAAAVAGKKAAPAGRKQAGGRAAAADSSSEDPMDSSSEDEEVAPVRRKAAAMAVSSNKSHTGAAPAPALSKKQQAAAAAAAAAAQEDSDDSDDSEESEEEDAAAAAAEAARKAAKKARKEERRLKREAKKAKKEAKKRKQQQQQQDDEDESDDDDEEEAAPAPVVAPAKKSSKQKAPKPAAASGDIDLFSVLDAPVAARSAQPTYAAAPSPYAAAAYPPAAAAAYPAAAGAYSPYASMAQQTPPNAFSPYGSYGSYPVLPSQHLYGQQQQPPQPFGAAAALSQLQPLGGASVSGRTHTRAASFVPGEDNTTAVGGVYDPRGGAGADPFADVAPNLAAQPKAKSRR